MEICWLNSSSSVVLQAGLFPLFLGAVGECAHSLQALLQRQDALLSAALEHLPAVMDSLGIGAQLASVTGSRKIWLLHCQAELLEGMQALVTSVQQPARK